MTPEQIKEYFEQEAAEKYPAPTTEGGWAVRGRVIAAARTAWVEAKLDMVRMIGEAWEARTVEPPTKEQFIANLFKK